MKSEFMYSDWAHSLLAAGKRGELLGERPLQLTSAMMNRAHGVADEGAIDESVAVEGGAVPARGNALSNERPDRVVDPLSFCEQSEETPQFSTRNSVC